MRDLKKGTKQFALDCWLYCRRIPYSREYNAYVNQLIHCSSSVGANYRASQRAKSTADFINKLKIVEEEAEEILAITVASINTARRKQGNNNS